jgi:hypothetical protein
VRETVTELQHCIRLPRVADAWRFFRAARELELTGDQFGTSPRAYAQQFGRRLALAATGWDVSAVVKGECGSSAAFVVELVNGRTYSVPALDGVE